ASESTPIASVVRCARVGRRDNSTTTINITSAIIRHNHPPAANSSMSSSSRVRSILSVGKRSHVAGPSQHLVDFGCVHLFGLYHLACKFFQRHRFILYQS